MPATIAGAERQTVADFTTTTKEEGERMSELIRRAVVRKEDQIQRALQVLQKAQPHDPVAAGEMQPLTHGDWIDIRDVVKAIRILEEGRQ